MASVTQATAAPSPAASTSRNLAHSFQTKLFYGFGSVAYGVKDNGFSVLLLLFYNQVLGLDAQLAGLAIMIALLVDAFLDPAIGYVSDHFHSRWGRRHPFMYAAAAPVAVSYMFLFNPPAGLHGYGLFTYLTGLAVLVRFFIALYEIPSSALVAELTQGYDQRTSYLSFRYFFGWMGGLTMSLLAFGVFLSSSGPSGQLLPAGYRAYGIAASCIMFTAIMASALGTHQAIPWLARPAISEGRGTLGNALKDVAAALSSRSALTALLANVFYYFAIGLGFALGTYFYTYVWGLTAPEIAKLVAASYAAATIALLVAPKLSRQFDKRKAAIGITIAVILMLPVPLLLSFAGLFPPPGSLLLVPVLLVFLTVSATLTIVQGIMLTSMLADVVEDNEVRTGLREEGVFFASNTFAQKCVSGLGIFGSASLLAFARFPVHAAPGHVAATTMARLGGSYVAAVTLLNIGTIVCVLLFRISRKVHAANLAILAERRGSGPAPTGLDRALAT